MTLVIFTVKIFQENYLLRLDLQKKAAAAAFVIAKAE
jgi:hypothetical protein